MALTNKTPLISIIIPVYNEAEHISDVINQVKSLTLDYEIIVVDDCSTDG
ncbi:MAG TPA: glycosyltransferase, partial [bacterium (Candidatus Stahlbacteria)]|nr:glycosyltransferase [Candidatus Stahlbacteria bacterium]